MGQRLLLALLLAISCGPPPLTVPPEAPFACRTACGLKISSADWCVGDIQGFEDKLVDAFANVGDADLRFAKACTALAGWRVDVQPSASWSANGVKVNGEADCGAQVVRVGPAEPSKGTLPHFLAHAIQRCVPVPPTDPNDPAHSNWGPIFLALWGANFQP